MRNILRNGLMILVSAAPFAALTATFFAGDPSPERLVFGVMITGLLAVIMPFFGGWIGGQK